jgi:hypothetical protein
VFANLVGREAAAVGIGFGKVGLPLHTTKDLGGQNYGLATAASLRKPTTENFLGVALLSTPPIHIRRIEEVDAKL